MKVCYSVFLLFRIFAYTNSSPHNTPHEEKGTDLALKVVLGLNVKDNSTNESVLDENKIPRPDFRAPGLKTFTGFIQEVFNILNTYEGAAFADFFDILEEEIRKYHYRGCTFYELTENYELRSLTAEKLGLTKRKPVIVLKADINKVADIIRHETYDKNVKELLDYINSLYREDAREKFGKVLSDLKAYGNSTSERSKKYLVKIIRDGVRAIVFNHYTDLNINVRRELKKKNSSFLKNIKEAPSSRIISCKTNLNTYKPAVSESENIVKTETTIIEDKPKPSLKTDPTSISDNNNIPIFRTSDVEHQEEAQLETSKKDNNNQRLQITYLNTDKSSNVTIEGNSIELSQDRQRELVTELYATLHTEDISRKNTEKPEIIFRSDLKSKLVQRMLESTSRLSTVQPTTTPGLRPKSTWNEDAQAGPVDVRKAIPSRSVNARDVSDDDLRTSKALPLPEEDLSIDVFDREERKRQMSLADGNRTTTAQHGIKDYIKRMRYLLNPVNQIKKFDDYNQNSRMNVISNGYKVKNVVDKYEISKSRNKVREPIRNVKKTSSVNEDGQDIESDEEIVKNNDRLAYKLKNKKKDIRSETTKPTKSSTTVQSVKNPVHRSSEPLSTAKNNAGNTTVNDNHKKLSKTTFKVTKKVRNAILNVIEEVKQKRIIKSATDDYVTKDNLTRKYRRVLEFSSPPLYDQPFFDYHTFQEGLHPAHISNGVSSVTDTAADSVTGSVTMLRTWT